jgi:ribonuclease-3
MANIEQKIAIIEQIIGYIYVDKVICLEALQMDMDAMYVSLGGIRHLVMKNKNLEAVGDAIIDAVLCKKWYEFRDSHGKSSSINCQPMECTF